MPGLAVWKTDKQTDPAVLPSATHSSVVGPGKGSVRPGFSWAVGCEAELCPSSCAQRSSLPKNYLSIVARLRKPGRGCAGGGSYFSLLIIGYQDGIETKRKDDEQQPEMEVTADGTESLLSLLQEGACAFTFAREAATRRRGCVVVDVCWGSGDEKDT